MIRRLSLVSAALLVAASASAQNSLGLANEFNAWILGNANASGGHSDGALAIGGNFSTGYEANQHRIYPTSLGKPEASIYVQGNVNVTGPAKSFSNSYVGGSVTGGTYIQNGGSMFTGASAVDPTKFSTQATFSLNQSIGLGNLPGNLISPSDPNNLFIDVSSVASVPGYAGVKIFNLPSSLLANPTFQNLQLGFNNIGSDTVIVNVTGGGAIDFKWKNSPNNSNRVLYNFPGASSLLVGTNDSFNGSILAPSAAVTQYKNIQGNLIAGSWTTVGAPELHFGNQWRFQGNAPVPEPASMAVLGLGLAALKRRRKNR